MQATVMCSRNLRVITAASLMHVLLASASIDLRAPAQLKQADTISPRTQTQVAPVWVGAHYFSGWHHCYTAGCYSHFHGFTPTGTPTLDFFTSYPDRIPLLGNSTALESTIAAEVATADTALDFFDVLYYDGGTDCGMAPEGDPGLRWCLNSALAFMLNSSTVWTNTSKLHFFISYSNDIDRNIPNAFVGTVGEAKWLALVKTWVGAMSHPRYLTVNERPVFKILIPEIFVSECGYNVTLATIRLEQLRNAAQQAGLNNPIIGGGWENPSIPASVQPPEPRPHPDGYMMYPDTNIPCSSCDIKQVNVSTLFECEALCNTTQGCTAFVIDSSNKSCVLKTTDGPGAPDSKGHSAYVRVIGQVLYDWTGSYNAAPPICPSQPNYECSKYKNSWFPNTTATGGKIFPYTECGDYQGAARTNHSHDRVPYLANVIGGFDPRPWEEHSPSFGFPSVSEWEDVLLQVKAQCEDETNKFGFPDASSPAGFQPAFNIYAWNEFGEGGIIAPTRGDGFMKVQTIAKVFGNAA